MSPRTTKQYDEIRQARKSLIKEVALTCFADEGFHRTTISKIAVKAGISKGLIYNYFPGKDDILSEIISESMEELYSSFDIDRDGHLSQEEFEIFIRKMFVVVKEKSRFWRLLFAIMMQTNVYEEMFINSSGRVFARGKDMKSFSEDVVKIFMEYFAAKGEGQGEGYDPMVEMMMFANTLKGFSLTFLFSEELYSSPYYEKMVDTIINRYK